MADNERQVVQRLWGYCTVLRDDGLSYPDYVEQLTYLLFIKMASEVDITSAQVGLILPHGVSWDALAERSGADLLTQYESILTRLSTEEGILGAIFHDARNKIRDPAKLQLLVLDLIGSRNWSSLNVDVKGAAYEGLLEKNAQDTKSGAGQYFTPRPVVEAVVTCVAPKTGETVHDPACGTGGFLIAALQYNSGLSVSGFELVPEVTRLAAMNLLLHGYRPAPGETEVPVSSQDSLARSPDRQYNLVLTNPPFGSRSSVRIANSTSHPQRGTTIIRSDFWTTTSNKELNFLQHVVGVLAPQGRAAVVVPDGVLTGGGAGAAIRRRLLSELDVHTLLRLPQGIFYAQGVSANVLFFDGRAPETPDLDLWVYDLRTDKRFTLMGRRLGASDLEEFVELYCPDRRQERRPTWTQTNPTGRWRRFSKEAILADSEASLDLTWLGGSTSVATDDDPDEIIGGIVADLQTALLLANELTEGAGS